MTDLLDIRGKRIAVVADPHLSFLSPEEVAAFSVQLKQLEGVDAFVCLGDLFDFWLGPGNWDLPPFQPLKLAFTSLSQAGVQVLFVRGNRDVLLEPRDVECVGGVVLDALIGGSHSSPVLLSHGDEYCLADIPYQRLRKNFRRPWLRAILRTLPWRLRFWLGCRMRKLSTSAIARKPMESMAINYDAVREACEAASCQSAWIGHLHLAATRTLHGGISLKILPAWEPGTPFETLELESVTPS